jgi:hypothetical protein
LDLRDLTEFPSNFFIQDAELHVRDLSLHDSDFRTAATHHVVQLSSDAVSYDEQGDHDCDSDRDPCHCEQCADLSSP